MIVALKTIGYIVSVVSVILIGFVAWQTVPDDQTVRLCLIGGVAALILGMVLRWISHLKDQLEKDRLAEQNDSSARPVSSASEPAHAGRPAHGRLYVAASDDPILLRSGAAADQDKVPLLMRRA